VTLARRSWSFRSLLFLQGALVAAVPLLVVVLAGAWFVLPELADDIERQQRSMARTTASLVQTHLASARRELQSAAALIGPAVAGGDGSPARRAEIDRILDALVGGGSLYEAIYVAGRDGIVTSIGLPAIRRGGRADLVGIDLSRREFVTQAMQGGELVWSPSFLSAVSGRLVVALAFPVQGGVLVAELSLGQFSQFLRELPVAKDAAVVLVDRRGYVIAHPRPEQAGQQVSLSDQALVRAAFSQGDAIGQLEFEGRPMVGAAFAISGIDWAVLVAQPVGAAFRLLDVAVLAMLAGFAVAVLLALGAAYLLASASSERLRIFARNAGAMAAGRHDLFWPKTRVTEFVQLADDLRRMAEAVQAREAAIKQSEGRYREVVESSADLITRVDAEGHLRFVNKTAERIYGVPASECVGRLAFDFVHPDDRSATQEAFLRWLASKSETMRFENRQIGADGRAYSILWSIHVHRNAEGEVVEFSSIGHDLTEYRRAEAEIRRLALVASSTSNAVLITDAEGRVEWTNTACELLTGYSMRELKGDWPWRQRADAATEGELLDWMVGELSAGRGFKGVEIGVVRKDGKARWHEVEAQPVRDARGRVIQFVIIENDITDRRAAQEALRASEERLRATLESTPNVAVQWYDADGTITYWNQSSERVFGISAADAVGRPVGEVLGEMFDVPGDGDFFFGLIAQVDATGKAVGPFESKIRRHDGREVWILSTTFAIPGVSGSRSYVRMDVDISEEKALVDELQQSEQALRDLNAGLERRVEERTAALASAVDELSGALENLQRAQDELIRSEKLAALGSLVAGIAHELNTPIGNGLMAASTLDDHTQEFGRVVESGQIRRSALEQFVRDARTAAEIVVRNLKKASELVTSFKQVAVDQTSAQRREFVLDELVAEIVLTLRPSFKKTPYAVDYQVPPELRFDSYPGPLGQVLTNLINNALVHGFEGRDHGTVRVCATPEGKGAIRIEVSDDGLGIDPEHLPRIFDPFFTTKLGKGGSGLGLHIVHNLVTRVLGGSIRVASDLAGTRFTMTIPRMAPRKAADDER
jgi:PAS domain S-box-containing protein